jgi:hypothetical protein
MDYGNADSPDPVFPTSLWQTLCKMDGVYIVDLCRRTVDLGKWNISCNATSHPSIAAWLDNNLVEIWNQVPMDLPKFSEFPTPERLSRHRSPRSVASGLTNASPVSHYLKSLANRHQDSTKLTTIVRQPWRQTPPVESVQYEFHPTAFPSLPAGKPHGTTARTTESTVAGTSAVTAASLQDAVNRKLQALDQARTVSEANFQSRMNDLEDTLTQVKENLANIASTVTTQVLIGLQQETGLLWNQDRKIDQLQAKMLELLPLVKEAINLSENSANARATNPLSPLRKNRRLEQDSTMDAVLHE